MPATDLAHPELNRPLSIQEYKRIQEFPDDWKLGSLRNNINKLVMLTLRVKIML